MSDPPGLFSVVRGNPPRPRRIKISVHQTYRRVHPSKGGDWPTPGHLAFSIREKCQSLLRRGGSGGNNGTLNVIRQRSPGGLIIRRTNPS